MCPCPGVEKADPILESRNNQVPVFDRRNNYVPLSASKHKPYFCSASRSKHVLVYRSGNEERFSSDITAIASWNNSFQRTS